jgi:hypothetical protein
MTNAGVACRLRLIRDREELSRTIGGPSVRLFAPSAIEVHSLERGTPRCVHRF